jgi:hypothetical protein
MTNHHSEGPGGPDATTSLRVGRGPQSLIVPFTGPKLELLLMLAGRNHAWLASCLNVSPPAITNWKTQNRIPALHAQVACRLLSIDLATLLEVDMDRFRQSVNSAFAPGSGQRWKALVREGQELTDGLLLSAEDETTEQRRLRAVVFSRNASKAPLPQLPRVALGERIRFAFSSETVANLRFVPRAHVLCIEDPHGWAALCPTPHATRFVEHDGRLWLPVPGRKPLELENPTGLHKATAIFTAAALPEAIERAFGSSNVMWACDSLAAWIMNEAVTHAVFARTFNVVVA